MTNYKKVTEKEFFDFVNSCPFPIKSTGNSSMGGHYFNELTGRLVGTYDHTMTCNEYFLIDKDDDADDFVRDVEERYRARFGRPDAS